MNVGKVGCKDVGKDVGKDGGKDGGRDGGKDGGKDDGIVFYNMLRNVTFKQRYIIQEIKLL